MTLYRLIYIVSHNGLVPDGTKPIPEPILTDHQWGPLAFSWGQLNLKCSRYQSPKCSVKITHWYEIATKSVGGQCILKWTFIFLPCRVWKVEEADERKLHSVAAEHRMFHGRQGRVGKVEAFWDGGDGVQSAAGGQRHDAGHPATRKWVHTLRQRQNGRHIADNIFKLILLYDNVCWCKFEICSLWFN